MPWVSMLSPCAVSNCMGQLSERAAQPPPAACWGAHARGRLPCKRAFRAMHGTWPASHAQTLEARALPTPALHPAFSFFLPCSAHGPFRGRPDTQAALLTAQ